MRQSAKKTAGRQPRAATTQSRTTSLVGRSVREVANFFHVDEVTIRRAIRAGCPCVRRGSRGPGNGALLDLQQVAQWRGQTGSSAEQTTAAILEKIAVVLLRSLKKNHCDIRAGVQRDDAAVILICAWEDLCQALGGSYAFDRQPAAIRTLMSEL